MKAQIWDTAGLERFRDVTSTYYHRRGRGRGGRDLVSASDLNADLEKYHQESIQIN